MSSQPLWSFGFGSNMDVHALEQRKRVKVLEHTPAVLKGWKMAFTLRGIPFVEPAYANAVETGNAEDSIHGVAFLMTPEAVAGLDKVESGYDKRMVTLTAYDGRTLDNAFLYVNKPGAASEEPLTPSARYLGVLVKGARQAGLDPEYISALAAHPVYSPSPATLELRASLPKPEDLPVVTVEQLAQHKKGNSEGLPTRVGVLGYVLECDTYFASHTGRDITTRALMQLAGLGLDDNDDAGRPPYPIISSLTPEQVEYISTWLDHYLNRAKGATAVGFLAEFRSQQESGVSDWRLPEPKL
eukprot:Sspe_Gene.92870::Locus_65634_Transcript_1_1_Confidence_1.000_Length_1234::g.92870::m.92870